MEKYPSQEARTYIAIGLKEKKILQLIVDTQKYKTQIQAINDIVVKRARQLKIVDKGVDY